MSPITYDPFNTPRLMNQRTNQGLSIADLTTPAVMLDVLRQLIDEIWHAAPKEGNLTYSNLLPFDYAWHRITEHCLNELDTRVHTSLTDMLSNGVDLESMTIGTLVIYK